MLRDLHPLVGGGGVSALGLQGGGVVLEQRRAAHRHQQNGKGQPDGPARYRSVQDALEQNADGGDFQGGEQRRRYSQKNGTSELPPLLGAAEAEELFQNLNHSLRLLP